MMEKGMAKDIPIGLQIEALAVQGPIFEFLVGFEKTCSFWMNLGGSRIGHQSQSFVFSLAKGPKSLTGSAGTALALKLLVLADQATGIRHALNPLFERRGRPDSEGSALPADPINI